jgi:hypothetical protein
MKEGLGMKRETLLAAGVVVLANAVALVGVVRNRMGEPEASLELSHREFRLNQGGEDNNARWVSIVCPYRPEWIDENMLVELGFDPAAPKALPRPGFVALEFDPEAQVGTAMSRMAPVDAGADPVKLRARHPDRGRTLILRAAFRLRQGTPPRGEVAFLIANSIAVPPDWVAPHFAVRVAVGRNYEPYATGFRALSPPSAAPVP